MGGDLTSGDKFVIAVTVIGEAHENGLIRRSGAQVGDVVFVSGSFGASALGLALLQADKKDCINDAGLVNAHFRPQPRLCEAFALVRRIGSRGALMDASDGLADALFQISEASGVSMQIDCRQIPIDASVRSGAASLGLDPLTLALYGGEDYELVGCASPQSIDFLEAHFPFRPIGQVCAQIETDSPVVELVSTTDTGEKKRRLGGLKQML